jgi:hypothetical protein
MAPQTNMLWGGRFTGGLDPLMVQYNESIFFDKVRPPKIDDRTLVSR